MLSNKIILLAVPATMMVAGLALPGGTIQAAGTPVPTCAVQAVGAKDTAGQADSRFSIKDGAKYDTVSAKVEVTGPATCQTDVALATWEAPNGVKGQPYAAQKLFGFAVGRTLKPGTYTISTRLPDCFYQVDLVRGADPTATNGRPSYGSARLMGSLHGGTQSCVKPTPTPTPTTTPAPTPSATPAPQPQNLPDTGPAAGGLTGLGGMIGAGVTYARSRRSLLSAMRKPRN